MLNKIQKIVIGKPFLISLIFVCLIFTSLGVSIEHSYAADLNESDKLGSGVNVEDKLENSQKNKSMSDTNQNPALKAKTYSVNGGTFRDIQNAIDKASAGDTIKLSGKFVSKGDDTISMSKKLTITSPSQAILDGKNSTTILKIFTGATQSKLSNLRFVNGYSDSKGGAIVISAKSIAFDKCVFENNYANLSSGAIHTPYRAIATQGMLIKNCNFTNNGAGIAAGALGIFGHDFLIENCAFSSNYVKGYGECYGGAIQIGLDTEPSYGNVRNCRFINNKAISSTGLGHAGAGCVRNGSSYYNCIFINNSADWGAALTYHASGNLNNCTLINNTATKYGGAVAIMMNYLNFMNLNITNSIFKGNKAPLGGAVKLDGLNIKIEESTFDDNYASEYGGAVNINATNVKIINSKFNRNIANIDGGAVFIKGKDTTVKNSKFISNEAIPDVKKLNDGLGGAIYVNSTKVLAQNNEFKLNTARNGSAIYFDRNGLEFKLVNNTLYQNQAWVYRLPIFAHDIYYGESENIKSVIYGGNNIADFDNLKVSNAIYNAASNNKIEIDGEHPVLGATTSGKLYQDDREYNVRVLMMVRHEDGTIVYNNSLNTNYLGAVSGKLDNLKPGKYYVTAKHFEDNYYKAIANTTVFNVLPKTDNKILKSSNGNSIAYKDTVIWTLNITNNGPNDSTGVVVYDVLPEGLIWVNDDSNGAYNPKTGVLTIGSLKVGETIVLNIMTKVNATGKIVNKANVTGNEYDINLDNNHDEKEINVPLTVDLAIIKNVNVTNPNYGDSVIWTLTVSNFGPDVANDVKVTDIFSDSLIWIEDDSLGKYNPKTGIWNIGTLNKGKTIELNIVSQVNQTGNITNNVSVTSREYDIDLSNNVANKTIFVNKSGDLSILKTVNVSDANYGEIVKWTLTAYNNGPNKVNGVTVQDILPKGLMLLNYTASKGFYDDGIWVVCCLEKGETETLELICKVNRTGNITNIARISGIEYDPNLDNNLDNESIIVPPASDISVIKQVDSKNPYFGDIITWIIEVTNKGPDRATNIRVTDELPEGLIFKDYVSTCGVYQNGVWFLDYLNAGDSEYLNISCHVGQLGIIVNDVSAIANEFDINLSDNHYNESINVLPVSDLSIEKFVNVSNANYKDLIKWTLIVSNNGFNDATDVVVEDILPDSLEFISANGDYEEGIWYVGDLGVGNSKTLDIVTRIIKTGDITNVAAVYCSEDDPDLSNNEAEDTVHVGPAADLSITKTVSKHAYEIGQILTYNINVNNNGPDDAVNVKVSEEFPKSLHLKSFKMSTGEFNAYSNVWSIDKLAAGGEEKLRMEFEALSEGIFKNTASVASDTFDNDLNNNHDSALVKIIANTSDKIINDLTDNFTKSNVVKAENIKQPVYCLEKHSTANFIELLSISVIVSMIFGGGDIFRKR
ncbi:MAG: hypothetical protein MJ226_06775 [archaeon]|nr:hypothetical protein [archaeon]